MEILFPLEAFPLPGGSLHHWYPKYLPSAIFESAAKTLDEIRDVFVQILPVFIKIHPIDSRRGISFELPETPVEKPYLIKQETQGSPNASLPTCHAL